MRRVTAGELFEEHHLTVFRYLRRLSRTTSEAEDLAQEVFLRAVRAVPAYKEQGAGSLVAASHREERLHQFQAS